MHVGTKNKDCFPILKVKNSDMKTATKETYLGDVLTSDGKINLNIHSRCDKGQGIINQSISILKKISFGFYYFEIETMFRNSMFLNGILCSIGFHKEALELFGCFMGLKQHIFDVFRGLKYGRTVFLSFQTP